MSVLGFREHSTISSHHLHFALNPALLLVSYRYGQDVSTPDPSCTRVWEKHVKTSAHGQGWILVCGLLLWPWRCSHSVKDRQGNSELQHTLDVRRANVGSRVKRPDPKMPWWDTATHDSDDIEGQRQWAAWPQLKMGRKPGSCQDDCEGFCGSRRKSDSWQSALSSAFFVLLG